MDILIRINNELRIVKEDEIVRLAGSDQEYEYVGRVDKKTVKSKFSQEQKKKILNELVQNMKYFNNLPFGEIHKNFREKILNHL